MNAMLPAHLTETLNSVGDAAKALTVEVREEGQRRDAEAHAAASAARRQNRFVAGLLVIVAVLVLGLLTIVVQNRLRANQNSEILRQTANTSSQIADCTNVGGKCYEQGAARTSVILRTLIRAQIYIEPCRKVSSTDAETEACVMRKLAASTTPAPTPQPSVTAPGSSGG